MEENRTIESSSVRKKRWEDLNTDCLIKIFEKLGLESLIIDIPFVCKSWYKASLDPLLYKVLHFEVMPVEDRTTWATITAPDKRFAQKKYSKLPPSIGFIKIAVKRSCGIATEVVFPEFLDDHPLQSHFTNTALNYTTLVYVLERCPGLKRVIVPYYSFIKAAESRDECLLEMISKLKNLQSLATLGIRGFVASSTINDIRNIRNFLNKIHINCQNLQSISVRGFISSSFASTIVVENWSYLMLPIAKFQDVADIRNLSLIYTLAGVDCIDCAVNEGIDAAGEIVNGVRRPWPQELEKKISSEALEWDSLTAKFAASANLPFLLLQLPQILLNAQNLMSGNNSALLAVPWLMAGNVEVMWSTFVPNNILPGALAFGMAVAAVIMARMGKLSKEGIQFVGSIFG
ncbi:F-box/LRR-repeat protein [Thalictrum thalictroides]|uniref:F-box/LRR-repeat protein n=1 Tax=Thalictrum thalictroides TaxID=46969 RepID=A0A7J6VDJ8_THATH|nr:F-box/LRR-repeat protein [Thalictrum thalictroides]